MNEEQMQQPSADKSAAALSFATMLSERVMKAQNPMQEGTDPSKTPETAPEQKKPQEDESNVRDMIKQELSPIIELLKDLLKEDGQDKA